MEDLEVVRTIDVVYEFTEPLLPYTLAGTFLLTVLLVGCPLTAPYFSEMRRATSDFRWVAMSLLSLAVVLWHSGYISRTQNAFWALETQRSLLQETSDLATVFDAEWCHKTTAAPLPPETVNLELYCQENAFMRVQVINIARVFNSGSYEWHNAPLFKIFPDLWNFEIDNHTDATLVRQFVFTILRKADEFNRLSHKFRNEAIAFRSYVQITLIRWLLLHFTALYGAIRLMRAYFDIKKAHENATE